MTSKELSEQLEMLTETLYRVSYSQLSQKCDRDDAIQETLLKVWSKRHTLKDIQLLQAYTVRILINECHNIHRKRKRETLFDEMPQRISPPDEHADVHDALFLLDEALRLPIVLHYMEGFKLQEIAEILSLPLTTVKWRMAKARKELARILGDDADDYNYEEGYKLCLKEI